MVSLGQTVVAMQLSGSDEMGRVERGVASSRPGHQSCSLYAPAPLSSRRCVGVLEASGVVEVVVWHRLDRLRSGLHELHCFVLFVTCHSCCHAELRKPDLEVTASYLTEVEAVQHVHLTNILVWFGLLGDIKDGCS